jgi:hypothetical protein
MKKGIANGRTPAAETCATRGWVAGTRLVSKEWSAPKSILKIERKDVMLIYRSTHQQLRRDRLQSFPEDVQEKI